MEISNFLQATVIVIMASPALFGLIEKLDGLGLDEFRYKDWPL